MKFGWMKSEFKYPSETLRDTAIWKEKSDHEAEAGVLVFDKSNHASFFGYF